MHEKLFSSKNTKLQVQSEHVKALALLKWLLDTQDSYTGNKPGKYPSSQL